MTCPPPPVPRSSQPTLSKLGVQLDTRTVTSVVREEKGVASKLVYQLKMKLDVMSRDVEKSKLGGTLGRTVTARTRPSRAVADSYLGVGSFNSAHAAYETAKSKIFEDVVRSREIKPNFLLEEAATVRFRAEGERQAADVLDHTLTLRASIDEHVAERRAHQLNAFNASRETKAIHVAAQYATHAEMLEARREVEKREVEIELAIAEKNRLLAVARNDAARGEALDGIDAFERNLQRMAGAGGGSTDGGIDARRRRVRDASDGRGPRRTSRAPSTHAPGPAPAHRGWRAHGGADQEREG